MYDEYMAIQKKGFLYCTPPHERRRLYILKKKEVYPHFLFFTFMSDKLLIWAALSPLATP